MAVAFCVQSITCRPLQQIDAPLNSEIQLIAYRRIFEYRTTTPKDHASIVYSLYLQVESSPKNLVSTCMPRLYLCVAMTIWQIWIHVHVIAT